MHYGVNFSFGSAKVCSTAIFETFDTWIAATDYYTYFYITVVFSLTPILLLINFTSSQFLIY